MPAGKGQMGAMKGPDGKPMAKADMDKMRKMCGGMEKSHGDMGHPKSGGHPPAPKADPPKAHNHE